MRSFEVAGLFVPATVDTLVMWSSKMGFASFWFESGGNWVHRRLILYVVPFNEGTVSSGMSVKWLSPSSMFWPVEFFL